MSETTEDGINRWSERLKEKEVSLLTWMDGIKKDISRSIRTNI